MPFLRAKGLQQGRKRSSGRGNGCLNALPAGEGSATTREVIEARVDGLSQCPSCGRRVCNCQREDEATRFSVSMPFLRAKGLQHAANAERNAVYGVSMPFLRAKGLQRRGKSITRCAQHRLNALPAGEGSATFGLQVGRSAPRYRLNALPAGEGSATSPCRGRRSPPSTGGLNALPAGEGSATCMESSSDSPARHSLNALPAGEGSATRRPGPGQAGPASQCPSCGRRVCNMQE